MDTMNSISIVGGGYTAEIGLTGGQLLRLRHQDDELIVPAEQTEGAFAGAVLAPWPNRTAGASYSYAGGELSLPVTEEETGAALHGLLIDTPLTVQSQKDNEVQLQGRLEPTEGYPFGLDVALIYRVSPDVGLSATLMARYRPQVEIADGGEGAELKGADAEDADTEAADTDGGEAVTEGSEDAGDSEGERGESEFESESPSDLSGGTEAEASPETAAASQDSAPQDATARQSAAPETAPFGAGFHPYLTAGGAPLKECRLRLPARTILNTATDGTVTSRETVSGDLDLTNGPLLAGRGIDHAYTDLPDEGWTAELVHGPSGFVVRMIADTPWVQVYTGERIDRAGVAVEPMTCPPNALNSGEDLVHLAPGSWYRVGYSIEAIRAD